MYDTWLFYAIHITARRNLDKSRVLWSFYFYRRRCVAGVSHVLCRIQIDRYAPLHLPMLPTASRAFTMQHARSAQDTGRWKIYYESAMRTSGTGVRRYERGESGIGKIYRCGTTLPRQIIAPRSLSTADRYLSIEERGEREREREGRILFSFLWYPNYLQFPYLWLQILHITNNANNNGIGNLGRAMYYKLETLSLRASIYMNIV